jgi:hypothetical protein
MASPTFGLHESAAESHHTAPSYGDDAPAYLSVDILWLLLVSAENTGGAWLLLG